MEEMYAAYQHQGVGENLPCFLSLIKICNMKSDITNIQSKQTHSETKG